MNNYGLVTPSVCSVNVLNVFTAVLCPDPGEIQHALRYGSAYNYTDTVYYSCMTGYNRTSGIFGNIQITCGFDSQWNGWDSCEGNFTLACYSNVIFKFVAFFSHKM